MSFPKQGHHILPELNHEWGCYEFLLYHMEPCLVECSDEAAPGEPRWRGERDVATQHVIDLVLNVACT